MINKMDKKKNQRGGVNERIENNAEKGLEAQRGGERECAYKKRRHFEKQKRRKEEELGAEERKTRNAEGRG
jgi:hypothetical protein